MAEHEADCEQAKIGGKSDDDCCNTAGARNGGVIHCSAGENQAGGEHHGNDPGNGAGIMLAQWPEMVIDHADAAKNQHDNDLIENNGCVLHRKCHLL